MDATPVRCLVVWCPHWPVDAHRPSPQDAVAVVYANRVEAASRPARDAGVTPGLRRREAQGRCPSLEILDRDPALEARRFEPVLGAIDDIAPRVEAVAPGWCVVPTRGPSRYFGGDDALAALVAERVRAVVGPAVEVHIGVADGPVAARVAAGRATGAPVVVPAGDTAAFLAPLPVAVLERPELTDVLHRLGIDTLGALAALRRADVVGRFGAEGERAHRLASGLDERPPATTDPPPDLAVAVELDPPVERVDQAAFAAKAAADELERRLIARGGVCTRVVIEAETEHGEVLARTWRHEGALDATAIAARARWQLDGWLHDTSVRRPTGGLVRLTVRADDLVAAIGRQLSFWGDQPGSTLRVQRAVARVQGLLGAGTVRVPERRGGRGPAQQLVLVPAEAVSLEHRDLDGPGDARAAPWPGRIPPPWPARVHQPEVPAEVVDADGRSVAVSGRGLLSAPPARLAVDGRPPWPVTAWAGPWPVDERWWDADGRRRRARLQVTVSGRAHLLALEGGRWWVEATYD